MGDIILSKEVYETVRIKDHTGKVLSEFSFNPSDANIVERYDEFVNGFEDLKEQISAYEEESDKGTYEKNKETMQIINKKIHEKINYLLNTDAADSIFSVMGALSPLPSGDYYFMFILEQIGKKIQNVTGARIQKMDMKIKKHTAKYHK
jgi:hypothetical protein